MMQDVHDYFVLFDGVYVPVTSISFQWVDEGATECSINVPGWAETDKIVESTVVEVYHAHARGKVHARHVVRVPYTSSTVPDEDALRSSFTEECAQTIGEKSSCHTPWSTSSSKRFSFGELTDVENHQLRWVGFVASASSSTSANPMARDKSFSCRSIDALWDSTSLIQLIGGSGTLNQEERRFLGQDTDNERSNGTLLAGTGRRDMANAILAILKERDGNFSVGVRRLLSQYARLVNKSTRHRYETLRALNQMTVVDDDETVQRLIGTTAFDRYLRDTIQGMYTVPVRQAMLVILSFVGYRIVPVPSPPYFPIGIEAGTRTETVTTRRPSTRAGALTGTIRWQRWSYTTDLVSNEVAAEFEEAFARGENPGNSSAGGWIEAGQADLSITPDNLSFSFSIPQNKTSFGAIDSVPLLLRVYTYLNWQLAPTEPAGTAINNNPVILVPGQYRVGIKIDAFAGIPSNLYSNAGSHDRLQCTLTLTGGQRVATTVAVTSEIVVESEPSEETSSLMTRLGSYFIGPNLWYAIPPLCNIILPSQIMSKSVSTAGMSRITRLVAKVNPGLSGSRKSFVDKFAAPNSSDMNRAISDADDDLLDARNLTPREYLTGVVAEVSTFDAMARLVSKSEFEKYLKYRTVQKFWDKNLSGETMQLQIRPTPNLVVGTTALVVINFGSGEGETDISPEQRALIRRISILRRWKAQLTRCLGAQTAIAGRKSVVIRYIRSLIAARRVADEFLSDVPNDSSADTSTIHNDLGVPTDGYIDRFRLTWLESNASVGATSSSSFRQERVTSVVLEAGEEFSIGNGTRLRVYYEGVSLQALTALIGPEASVIDPGLANARIARLPSVSLLREWLARVESASDGSACTGALRSDISVLDDAIEDARTLLAGLGGSVKEDQAYIGYVKAIQEQANARQHSMSVTLTHVRRVGEDIDQDGIAGDDPEATIAFGEDGYLDEKFSIRQIGQKLYLPAFGCGSMADHPFVQEALDQEQQNLDENSDVPGADASDIRAEMRHPSVCGHSCLDEADALDGEGNGLTATYVVRSFLSKLSTMTDSSIEEWLHDTTQRPGLTLPDAHRNGTLYYSKDERAVAKVSESFFDEADARLYPDGTTLDGFFSKSFPDIDSSEPTANMRFHSDMTPEERSIITQRRRAVSAVAARAKNYGYSDT